MVLGLLGSSRIAPEISGHLVSFLCSQSIQKFLGCTSERRRGPGAPKLPCHPRSLTFQFDSGSLLTMEAPLQPAPGKRVLVGSNRNETGVIHEDEMLPHSATGIDSERSPAWRDGSISTISPLISASPNRQQTRTHIEVLSQKQAVTPCIELD